MVRSFEGFPSPQEPTSTETDVPREAGGFHPPRITLICRITRHFHEKAGPCQAVFLDRANRTADCRPTGGTVSLQPFLLRKVFGSAIHTADRRPAGGAQCCHPEFSNHRLALLPSALFAELLLRCQLGVLNWKRVLPSRTRTECLCFQRRRSWRVPQSPELGDLFQVLSGGHFFLLLPHVVIPQWLVHFTRYPQSMKQDP
jgi:hypothetical protein